jgi:hypothetical protein
VSWLRSFKDCRGKEEGRNIYLCNRRVAFVKFCLELLVNFRTDGASPRNVVDMFLLQTASV